MKTKLIARISRLLQARKSCVDSNNIEWLNNHELSLYEIERQFLPSGSGIDAGTKIELSECNNNKIVLSFGYHHINDGGYYDGWTEHKCILTPSFDGFNMRITGKDKNMIKDYLFDVFDTCLNTEIEY